MGVLDLNKIKDGSKIYAGKFNTVIIDGSNLIFLSLSSALSRIKKDNNNNKYNLSVIDENIVRQFYDILESAYDYIKMNLNYTYKTKLMNDKNLFITFDTINTVTYHLSTGEELNLKEAEQNERRKKADRTSTIEQAMNALVLEYEEDEIEHIKNTLLQYDYYNNNSNLIRLTGILIQRIKHDFPKANVIEACSEADLVIKNIASIYNFDSVLVCSVDTDYFVLCSDLENVYKTEVTMGKEIFYPFMLWKELLFKEITYEDISILATILGNDYTVHQKLMGFNLKHIYELFNLNGGFENLKKSRLKNIKPLIDNIYPENSITSTIELRDNLIQLGGCYKNSFQIYKDWKLNYLFKEFETKDYNIEIKNYLNKLEKKFGKILDFNDEITDSFNDYYNMVVQEYSLKDEYDDDL